MDSTSKSIVLQVAYKGVIELAKMAKVEKTETIERLTWEHYQMLERLIEKAINPYAGESDIDYILENLIPNSVFDEDQRQDIERKLTGAVEWETYWKIYGMLKVNQLSALDNPGSAKKKDLHKELDKKEAREK